MNFLKGFGVFILSFLLFISLSLFGLALLVNCTALSPAFVQKQVDSLDISAVARDISGELGITLPAEIDFLEGPIYNVIDAQEPEIKNQMRQAVAGAYDYLLGKADSLVITISLEDLKNSLKEDLWQELNNQAAAWLRDNLRTELEPYIVQNLAEYRKILPAELARLSDAQLTAYLDVFLKQIQDQIISTGKAPELTGLLESLVKPFYSEYYDMFAAEIPDTLTADETNIPADVMEQIRLARQYIGYFQIGFYVLIILILLLAGGIFLIYRNIPEPSLALGIDFTLFSIIDMAGALVARSLKPMEYITGIPPSLETWLNGLYADIIRMTLIFSAVVLAVGIALIVVSLVFRHRAAEA